MQCEHIRGGKVPPGNSLNVRLTSAKCSCLVKCGELGVCAHELKLLGFQKLKNTFLFVRKALDYFQFVDMFWLFKI